MSDAGASALCLDWGWAGSALEEGHSGDLHIVVGHEHGALAALVDGLGHGPEAELAAHAVVPVLEASPGLPVMELVRLCHEALRRTRGVVMSLVAFSTDGQLTWTGVGNVEANLVRARSSPDRPDEALGTRPGVVGYQLPPLRAATLTVGWGDTLVMVTDGIRSGFTRGVSFDGPPAETARAILERHAKGTDDAHVLVARFVGGGP